jgi:hypothetical protein
VEPRERGPVPGLAGLGARAAMVLLSYLRLSRPRRRTDALPHSAVNALCLGDVPKYAE